MSFFQKSSPHETARLVNLAYIVAVGGFAAQIVLLPKPTVLSIWIACSIPLFFWIMAVVCPSCGKSPIFHHLAGPIVFGGPLLGYPNGYSEKKCSKCGEDLTKGYDG